MRKRQTPAQINRAIKRKELGARIGIGAVLVWFALAMIVNAIHTN